MPRQASLFRVISQSPSGGFIARRTRVVMSFGVAGSSANQGQLLAPIGQNGFEGNAVTGATGTRDPIPDLVSGGCPV